MADKEYRFSWTVLIGDALLLLCALPGLAGSFLSLYGNPDALPDEAAALDFCAVNGGEFLACAVVFALIVLAVWSLPRYQYAAAGGLAALWACTLLSFWDEAAQGAGVMVRDISIQFSQRVDWGRVFVYERELLPEEEAAAVRIFLLLVLAALALLVGWAVVRTRCWWLVLEFTLPFLLPGLLADLYPDWLPFLALSACWCVMLITALCKWAAPSGRGRLTLVVFPVVAGVLLCITALFPREGYTRPAWARQAEVELINLSNRVSQFFSRWDGPLPGAVTYVGAAEEADLAHAGPLNYIGRTVLRVSSDYKGRLYLRGSSLAVYEHGVWKALPEGTYEDAFPDDSVSISPLYFPAMQEQDGGTVYSITVENVGAVGACVYAPYFLLPQDVDESGMLPVEDAYLARRQGLWTHSMTFVERTPPSEWGEAVALPTAEDGVVQAGFGPGAAQSAANAYSSFAAEHYLDVPEELREGLEQTVLMWQSTRSTLSEQNPYAPERTAKEIGDFLATFCQYDPNTPAAPEGVDPVLYFLEESRRGYCMHYASAVTLMLRTMGIPARYVSGFTVESDPRRQVTVSDRAAHAWVEVWLDGFGWYPVDVTPPAALEFAQQGEAASDDPSVETPEPTPEPTLPPPPTDAPDSSAAPDSKDGPGTGGGGWAAVLGALRILAWIAAAGLLAWLVQFGAKRLRARRMAGPDANRAALVCYGYLRRLERWGGKLDERAVELAQKARFSQHTLTREELSLLCSLVDRERTRLCVTPGRAKRLLFRYFWGMPKPRVSLAEDDPD